MTFTQTDAIQVWLIGGFIIKLKTPPPHINGRRMRGHSCKKRKLQKKKKQTKVQGKGEGGGGRSGGLSCGPVHCYISTFGIILTSALL